MDSRIDWNDQKQVLQALLLLHSFQTDAEQIQKITAESNGVGFNMLDAAILTSIAEQVINSRFITKKQYDLVNVLLRKYSGQINSYDFSSVFLDPKVLELLNRPDAPAKRTEDLLTIKDGKLQLFPVTYPSAQIKTLKIGFHWDRDGSNSWVGGDLSISSINAVSRMFPRLQKSAEVFAFEEVISKEAELPDWIHQTPAFPHQKEGTAHLLKARHGYLALAPGLGKSMAAEMAAQAANAEHCLIICPLSLVRNWQNEVKKWIGEKSEIWWQFVGTNPGKYTITNYDTVVRKLDQLIELPWDTIIIDEGILVKNHKRVQKKKEDSGDGQWHFTTKRVEAVFRITRNRKNVWILSGAPTSKYYDELWSQLHILDERRFPGYWAFAETYTYVSKEKYGWKIIGNKEGAADMLKDDLADIFFARTQDEVMDLPPWIFDNIEIDMDPEQERMYVEMEEDFLAELPTDEGAVLATNTLAQMTRLIQIASNPTLIGASTEYFSAKWKAAIEMLEFERGPFIIWTSFIKTATSLLESARTLKYEAALLTGATKPERRQEIVDSLQSGNLDLIVAHPAVGKFGLTLTAAHTAIYAERNYMRDDYYQSLYRVRRIGTTSSPHIMHLISSRRNSEAYTIDHVIDRVLQASKDGTIALTSGLIKSLLNKEVTYDVR